MPSQKFSIGLNVCLQTSILIIFKNIHDKIIDGNAQKKLGQNIACFESVGVGHCKGEGTGMIIYHRGTS